LQVVGKLAVGKEFEYCFSELQKLAIHEADALHGSEVWQLWAALSFPLQL